MSDNEAQEMSYLVNKRIDKINAEITALNRSVDSIVAVNARLEDELAKYNSMVKLIDAVNAAKGERQ